MLTLDLSEFPVLTTERLILRELMEDDALALFAMRSDERVMRHIGRPRATTLDDAVALITTIAKDREENNGITWALTLKGDEFLIGTIGFYRLKKEHFRAEVGYMLHPDHWGRGLMGEALEAVVQEAFTGFGFHSIEAVTVPANATSNGLLARHGFVMEGFFRENFFWNGSFHDSVVWSRVVKNTMTILR